MIADSRGDGLASSSGMNLDAKNLNPAPSPPSSTGDLSLRPVTESDFEELVALRIAAMRESLERVGRFDPTRARERLRKSFFPAHTWFILAGEARIGFYTFRPADDGFHLDHLYVDPAQQSRGIGGWVMQRLIAEARDRAQPIHVGALRESASNRFYRRHGFVPTREDEWDIYYTRPVSVPDKS